jgi:hypothetical protein
MINSLAKYLERFKMHFFALAMVVAMSLLYFTEAPVVDNKLSGYNVNNNPYELTGMRIAELFASKEMAHIRIVPEIEPAPTLFQSLQNLENELIELFPGIRLESLHKASLLTNRFSSSEHTIKEMFVYAAGLPVMRNLISTDTSSFLAIAYLDGVTGFDPDLFDELISVERAGMRSVAAISIPHIQRQTEKSMIRDYLIILPAIFLFVIAYLIYSYRSKGAVLFAGVNVAFSAICVFFFYSALNVKINQITATAIAVVIILSLSWSVHLLTAFVHYIHVKDKNERIHETLTYYFVPILLTALTTSIAFGSFLLSESLYMRQFGLVSACSLLAVFVFSIITTPVLLGFVKTHPKQSTFNPGIIMVKSVILNHKKTISMVLFSVLLISVFLISKITFRTNLETFIPRGTAIYQNNKEIRNSFFSMAEMDLLIEMNHELAGDMTNSEKRFLLLESVKAISLEIASWPEVFQVQSIRDQIEFEDRFSMPGIRLLFFPLSGNPYVAKDQLHYRVNIKLIDAEDVLKIKTRIDQSFSRYEPKLRHSIYSDFLFFHFISSRITSALLKSLLFSVVLIVIILFLLTRNIRITAVSILANSVPLGFLVLIFVLFGVDLNITTSVTLVVCLGLIVDDTIHILYRRIRLQKPLNELAIGMLKTSFILTVGFSFFLMSQSLQIQLFGVLNAIVFLIAIVSDLSIMSWLIKEHE